MSTMRVILETCLLLLTSFSLTSSASSPVGCEIPRRSLLNGTIWLQGYRQDQNIYSSIREGTTLEYGCNEGFDMYFLNGEISERSRIKKICRHGIMQGPKIECLPARCDCYDSALEDLHLNDGLTVGMCEGTAENGHLLPMTCKGELEAGLPEGQRSVECRMGEWVFTHHNCDRYSAKQSCVVPDVPNAVFHHESKQVSAGFAVHDGHAIDVTCQRGYHPFRKLTQVHEKLFVSCSDGQWSLQDYSCEQDKQSCAVPDVRNAVFHHESKEVSVGYYVHEGDIIDVTCQRGYNPVDKLNQVHEKLFARCNDGDWSVKDFSCVQEKKSCAVSNFPNTVIYHDSKQVSVGYSVHDGGVIQMSCQRGYHPAQKIQVHETLFVKCNDGQWSNKDFSCEPVLCNCESIMVSALLKKYLKPSRCDGNVIHGHQLHLDCSYSGMTLKKRGNLTCDSGEWVYPTDDDVLCTVGVRKCAVPDIQYALFHVDSKQVYPGEDIAHGKVTEIRCDDGYSPSHMSSIHSERMLMSCSNGEWSHKAVTCVPAQCKCEKMIDTELHERLLAPGVCRGVVSHGQTVNLECQDVRMTLVKGGVLICDYGVWIYPKNDDIRCVERLRNCTVPVAENMFFFIDSTPVIGGQIVKSGKSAEVKCDEGYSPAYNSVLQTRKLTTVCEDGKWSRKEVSCAPANCDCDLIYSTDMWRRHIKEGPCNDLVRHGETVKVQCRYPDKVLMKDGHITCEYGSWFYPTDKDVRCKSTSTRACPIPEIKNAIYHFGAAQVYPGQFARHEQTVAITCEDGLSPAHLSAIQEKVVIECDDGQWSRDKISCVPAQCNCQTISSSWLTSRYLTIEEDCKGIVKHGEDVEIACSHEATYLKQEGVIHCDSGTWQYPKSNDVRCLPKPCTVIPTQFHNANLFIKGELIDSQKQINLTHGTRMRLECKSAGYEIYKDGVPFQEPGDGVRYPEIMCLSGALIGRRTECRPARCTCSSLANELRGRNIESDECLYLFKSGASIRLDCKEGYSNPSAPFNADCDSRKWQVSTQAKCEEDEGPGPKGCTVKLSNFPNTELYKDGIVVNQKQLFIRHGMSLGLTCKSSEFEMYLDNAPFRDPGDKNSYVEIKCLDGVIKGSNTECRPARCTCIDLNEQIAGQHMKTSNCEEIVESDRSVQLVCRQGYSRSTQAPIRANCQSGKWIAPKVACTKHEVTTTVRPIECPYEVDDDGNCVKAPPTWCQYVRRPNINAFTTSFKIHEPKVNFSEGDSLTFRCQDITKFSFSGSNQRSCEKGKWNNAEPKCTELRMRSRVSAPVITYKVANGDSSVSAEGTLHVTGGATIIFNCHWFSYFGQPYWTSTDPNAVIEHPTWNENKDTYSLKLPELQGKHSGRYTCTNPYGKSHSIELKIKVHKEDRCTCDDLNEQIAAQNLRTGYCTEPIENDLPVQLVCMPGYSTNTRPPIRATCESGQWNAPKLTCIRQRIPTTASPVVCLGEMDEDGNCITEPEKTSCQYINNVNIIGFFNNFRIYEPKVEYSNGDSITFRCQDITKFSFSGSHERTCVDGKWTNKAPECIELRLGNRNSAPVITYKETDGDSSIFANGTLHVRRGASVIFSCHWFSAYGEPHWTSTVPNNVIEDPIWNDDMDIFSLNIPQVHEKHSGRYTCTNSYGKSHSIDMRIKSDGRARCTCADLNEQIAVQNLKTSECTEPIESDRRIQLTCKPGYSINTRAAIRATCQSGLWNAPKLTCIRQRVPTTESPVDCSGEMDEDGNCVIEPEKTSCQYINKVNVIGFFNNFRIYEPKVEYSSGDSLVFRCQDITKFSFSGSHERTCVDGKWTNKAPECTELRLGNRNSAPVITYKVTDGDSSIFANGTLHVRGGASIIFSCHWFNSYGEPHWTYTAPSNVIEDPIWNDDMDIFSLNIPQVHEKHSGRYTCTNSYGKSHSIDMRVRTDGRARCTCAELNEQIAVQNLKTSECTEPIESDRRIQLTCKPGYSINTRAAIRATCQSGLWNAPKLTCIRQRVPTTESPVDCSGEMDEDGNCVIEPEKTSCQYINKVNIIGFFNNFRIYEPKAEYSNGDSITFRCQDITKFSFSGSHERTCVDGKWTNKAPECTELRLGNRNSAPVITYKVTDGDSSIFANGTLHVRGGASIIFSCHWFNSYGEPHWTFTAPSNVIEDPIWNDDMDSFSLNIPQVHEKHSGRYTCTNSYGKAHSIDMRVRTDGRGGPITPTPRPTRPVTERPPVVPKEHCRFPDLGPNVEHFYKGNQIDVSNRQFDIGEVLIHRCPDITNFNFSGSIKRTCTAYGWSEEKPRCTELQLRNRLDAPVIDYEIQNGHSSVSQDGTLLVTSGGKLTFQCRWFKTRGKPTWIVENPSVVSTPPGWNRKGDSFELELVQLTDRHSGSYTCSNPYKKTHTIRLKVVQSID